MNSLFSSLTSCSPAALRRSAATGARSTLLLACLGFGTPAQAQSTIVDAQAASRSRTYSELVSLFTEWRTFEEPPRVAGLPDYSPATNAKRLAQLTQLQRRLARIDTTGWPVAEQVDHHLVRAEMNGMQYHLTVLKPFARDPAYYASIISEESDTPDKEGPVIHGAIRLYEFSIWPRTVLDKSVPLTAEASAKLRTQLGTIPSLLAQARRNLAGSTTHDLWVGGVRLFEEQSETLQQLAGRVDAKDAALVQAVAAARTATDDFSAWMRTETPKRIGSSGIGKAQYTWFLKNVLLVPLTWEEEVTITRRELARSHASLRLEEQRNRALPLLPVAESPDAFAALLERSTARYLQWVRDQNLLTMVPSMERSLRERMPPFSPASSRNFFSQTNHRDPIPLWTHLYHWWDNARIRETPHASPIRRGPLRYNVWMSRSEGMATVMEEWMMRAGLYDNSPRSREIVWIMLAARAARGLGNLYAHSNDLTMAQAADMHVNWTPRGWMRRDPLLGMEQHLYLRQPGYGASYVTGGRLLEEAMAERGRQLGSAFTMQRFLDEVNAAGMIPVSMIYWQLTGDDRMVRELRNSAGPLPFR